MVYDGRRRLRVRLVLGKGAAITADLIAAELQRAGMPAPRSAPLASDGWNLRLAGQPSDDDWSPAFRDGAGEEDDQLRIEHDAIRGGGQGPAGLLYAVQTLSQLIRVNRDGTQLPRLAIESWPSLRWRCAQDDLTRGPSSTLATLRRGVRRRDSPLD